MAILNTTGALRTAPTLVGVEAAARSATGRLRSNSFGAIIRTGQLLTPQGLVRFVDGSKIGHHWVQEYGARDHVISSKQKC